LPMHCVPEVQNCQECRTDQTLCDPTGWGTPPCCGGLSCVDRYGDGSEYWCR
jgi:hypothetical protein